MRRTLGALVIGGAALLGIVGCGGAKLHMATSLDAKAASDINEDACASTSSVAPVVMEPSPIVPTVEPPWGDRIVRVDVRTTHLPRELVLQTIRVREGSALDSDAIARDVKALYDLEAVETVRVDVERRLDDRTAAGVAAGVVLRYEIYERRVVGSVTYRVREDDKSGSNALAAGHWVPLAKGELYDPVRVARMRSDLERNLASEGHVHATVEARQRATSAETVDVCFLVDPGPKLVIDRIAFVGNDRVAQAELAALIKTHDDRVNRVGKPFRDDLLEYDLLFVSALYYDRGFVSVDVGPPRTTLDPSHGHITVEIPISEGPMYRIRSVRFAGAANHSGLAAEYKKRLRIKDGDVFNRTKVAEALERIRELHRSRGEDVDVIPETNLDTPHAELDLVIHVKALAKPRPSGRK